MRFSYSIRISVWRGWEILSVNRGLGHVFLFLFFSFFKIKHFLKLFYSTPISVYSEKNTEESNWIILLWPKNKTKQKSPCFQKPITTRNMLKIGNAFPKWRIFFFYAVLSTFTLDGYINAICMKRNCWVEWPVLHNESSRYIYIFFTLWEPG